MRVAVIGAGAMGGLAALLLDKAGVEVVVYELREERVAGIRGSGIRVRGAVSGEAFPEVGLAGEAVAPYDMMVLAMGAGGTGDALRPLSPLVHRDTVYLSLQDGNAVTGLAGLVGEERAFAAVAWVSAVEDPGGEVEVEDFRSLVLGAFLPGREAVMEPIVEALEAVFPGKARVTADLRGETWKRLEAAAAVSGLCAVVGAAPQEAQAMEGLDRLCGEAAGECRRAAACNRRDPSEPGSPWEDALWRRVKPPMLADIEAGRMTEIDHLSGSIVEHARAANIPVPVHSAILTLVKEIESGRHRPGEAALKELKRRIAEEKGMSLV